MEEAGAPGRGGEEPWTSPSRVTKRVPDAEGARDPHGPGSWTFEASKATQRSAGARLLRARGECASSSSARSSRNGLQARPTSAIAVFPGFGGKGPEAPSPSAPPPEPRRGRPLLARGFAAPPAGSSLRMALVRGPADPHARPSAKKLGSRVQKTHGRGRGAAGRGKTQGCRAPRSRR